MPGATLQERRLGYAARLLPYYPQAASSGFAGILQIESPLYVHRDSSSNWMGARDRQCSGKYSFRWILPSRRFHARRLSRHPIWQKSGRRAAACLHSIPGSGQFFRLRFGRSRRSVEARRRRPVVRTRQVEPVYQKRASTIVRFSAVLPEIFAEADEWRAELIALGSHIPSIATYILGSNAAHIVRHAKCSVLIISH
jgi:nucleotide-binding universal stress UspA family protein